MIDTQVVARTPDPSCGKVSRPCHLADRRSPSVTYLWRPAPNHYLDTCGPGHGGVWRPLRTIVLMLHYLRLCPEGLQELSPGGGNPARGVGPGVEGKSQWNQALRGRNKEWLN